jgi:hypothetical protein
MCLFVTVDVEVNQTELIFNIPQVTLVFCSLEMIARCRVLNQSAIKIASALCFPQMPQHGSENLMVTPFKRLIIYFLEEYGIFREKAQSFTVTRCLTSTIPNRMTVFAFTSLCVVNSESASLRTSRASLYSPERQ